MEAVKKLVAASIALLPLSTLATTITIDTWSNEGKVWQEKILPAFYQKHPDIKVEFREVAFGDYDQAILNKDTTSDMIMCRPFDSSLDSYKAGVLLEVTEMEGIENFPSFAQQPWQTESGATTFCLPMASVIHGFFYNKQIFRELGLTEPQTRDEFYQLLDTVNKDGRYDPMTMAVKDKWVPATLAFQNIGPNYWNGEDGRVGVIQGTQPINAPHYRAVFEELATWPQYLGTNYQNRTYADSIEIFTSGKAAVYPAGSWGIPTFRDEIDLGVFKPPVAKRGDECYFSDHTDIGMGINKHSENVEAASKLLTWMTTAEFAELLTNALPGFFSLSNHFIEVDDPTAATMLSWRNECDSTIRSAAQYLSRGENSLEDKIWQTTHGVLVGEQTPYRAVQSLQQSLSSWYPPQQKISNEEICY